MQLQTRGFSGPDGNGDPAKGGLFGISYVVVLGSQIDGLIAMLDPEHTSLPPFDTAFKQDIPQHHLAANGSQVFRTFMPKTPADGPTVDLYVQPGKPATRGSAYREARSAARDGACVVLGAGNQTFLSMADTLQKMFMHNYPCVLKHHGTLVRFQVYLLGAEGVPCGRCTMCRNVL